MVVAADDPDAQARSAWAGHLTGQWSLHSIAGDHIGVLQEPHVAVLAGLVRDELAALDSAPAAVGRRSAGAA